MRVFLLVDDAGMAFDNNSNGFTPLDLTSTGDLFDYVNRDRYKGRSDAFFFLANRSQLLVIPYRLGKCNKRKSDPHHIHDVGLTINVRGGVLIEYQRLINLTLITREGYVNFIR